MKKGKHTRTIEITAPETGAILATAHVLMQGGRLAGVYFVRNTEGHLLPIDGDMIENIEIEILSQENGPRKKKKT